MSMAEFRPKSTWRSTFIGLALMFMSVFVCAGVVTLGINTDCNGTISDWITVYPNAQQISQEFNFLQPNAMGITTTVYEVDAPVPIVARWYRAKLGTTSDIRSLIDLASVNWRVDWTDNKTAQITLRAECGNS